MEEEKILLSLKEIHELTGIGTTNLRRLLNKPDSKFTVRCGNKLYVEKESFINHIKHCAKYGISLY